MGASGETVSIPPLIGLGVRGPTGLVGRNSMGIGPAVERLVAVGYGLTYDLIFRSFRPYQVLLGEVLECAGRSLGARPDPTPPRVLELGCGTGNFSLALAERGYSVVGEDPYEPLIQRARAKAAAQGLDNATFHAGPRGDGGYDLVLSVHVLYAHPDPVAELRRALGRLRPGGHAIVANFSTSAPVMATAREVWSREGAGAALHSLLWLVPNAVFDVVRGSRQSHYWTEEEFRTCLEDVGFEVLEIRPTFLNGISLLAWCRKGL